MLNLIANPIKFLFLIFVGMSLSFALSVAFGTPEFAIALMTTLFTSFLQFIIVVNCILIVVIVLEAI